LQDTFFLTQGVFRFMRWLYESVTGQSIVLTIVISTVLIRALTIIGDIKSRQSTAKMSAIQPQINKLQKKYENDPARMQREMNKLMKENNVSMFGGCLPMLFTLPIFFIFINAFRQWGNEMMVDLIYTLHVDEEAGLELFRNFKFLWINNIWQADNGMQPVIAPAAQLLQGTKLHKLFYFQEHPEALELFKQLGFIVENSDVKLGMELAPLTDELIAKYNEILQPCVDLYAGYNNGWFILPILCCGTTFLSTWLIQKMQPQAANSAAGSTNKTMMWMMPIMTFVFCLTTNAAFALYWTVSNVISTITSFILNKTFAAKNAASTEEVVKA